MINYCLGFAFDRNKNVALIKKERPQWMKGKWNGIGGKIEFSDCSPTAAMVREFYEETGMQTSNDDWKLFSTVGSEFYHMSIFYGVFDKLTVETKTDELVSVWNVNLARKFYVSDIFETDLPWLMEMAYRNVQHGLQNIIKGKFYILT